MSDARKIIFRAWKHVQPFISGSGPAYSNLRYGTWKELYKNNPPEGAPDSSSDPPAAAPLIEAVPDSSSDPPAAAPSLSSHLLKICFNHSNRITERLVTELDDQDSLSKLTGFIGLLRNSTLMLRLLAVLVPAVRDNLVIAEHGQKPEGAGVHFSVPSYTHSFI